MLMEFSISDDRGVVEAIRFVGSRLDDMSPFFASLERPWWDSRREMYRTLGRSTRTPWIAYRDTPEALRYVYAKAAMEGLPAIAIQDTLLEYPSRPRLRRALEGLSSEGRFRAARHDAQVTVDVEYASNNDRGEGVAPPWAWPRIGFVKLAYNMPRRRSTSLAGSFQRQFAQQFSRHMGADKESRASGLTSEQLRQQAEAALARAAR